MTPAAGRPARPGRAAAVAAALLAAALLSGGCRQDMHDQPRFEPLEANPFFADGMASRPPVPGTVARGSLQEDPLFFTGKGADGQPVTTLPVPLDRALLERGRERFGIYCTPCHGRLGDGQGMVVRRGFKRPPSFHAEPVRSQPLGYYFDVITHGFGVMSPYGAVVPPADRWAIAAYIRVLQLSQRAPLSALDAADREALAALAAATAAGEPAAEPAPEH